MKRIRFVIVAVIALALVTAVAAFAGTAYDAAFTTSITYQNVGDADANIVFNFYPENNGTAIPVSTSLAQGAGSSLYVGGLDEIDPGFSGSVVMSSDQPVVATMVQISSDADVKNRPLSNGFSSGASEVLLATVLKNQFNSTSRFSVQNASSGNVDLTIEIFNADSPGDAPIEVTHNNLPAGAAKYFDMGQLSEVTASSFNGSAVVSAVESGTTNPADIVASVLELSTTGTAASSFEGVTSGSNTVYMPSAICNAFGGQNTAYAVQNTSQTTDADVTVTYSNGITETATVGPGAKNSFIGCDVLSADFSGSSTITSSGGEVVVIGKVYGTGLSTAFVGAPSGGDTLALPYVRWTESQWTSGTRQRAFVAIQNVGSALSDGDVTLKYLNKDGDMVATHTLGAMVTGDKLNSWAGHDDVVLESGFSQSDLDEFGYVGGFGGSVLVEGPDGSELVAVVRVSSNVSGGLVGEDYNGIPVN